MKIPCTKCENTMFKSFDTFHVICINCGSLRTIYGQQEVCQMPPVMTDPRKHYVGEKISVVSNRFIEDIRAKFAEISELRSLGKGWPEITSLLGFECGRATVQRHHGRMERGEI